MGGLVDQSGVRSRSVCHSWLRIIRGLSNARTYVCRRRLAEARHQETPEAIERGDGGKTGERSERVRGHSSAPFWLLFSFSPNIFGALLGRLQSFIAS